MAAKPKTTPLNAAMGGNAENLTPNQTKNALGQAVGKIAGLTKKAAQSKDAVFETGTLVLHTAENQGTLFLASMAEGYFGEEKLKVGGVDLRAPTAILAQGYGLYETLSGKKGGGHALAIGNGLMGSWLASVAVKAGHTLREKRNAPAQAQQPAGQVPVQQGAQPQVLVMTPSAQGAYQLEGPSGIPEGFLNGPVREVLLTPEPSAQGSEEEVGRRGGGRGGRGRRRTGGRGGQGGGQGGQGGNLSRTTEDAQLRRGSSGEGLPHPRAGYR
ncbi:MAG: hypothetical protein ABIO70_16880 [Pseudomonadota bacterium]